jgi:glutathionylspermidine synthase
MSTEFAKQLLATGLVNDPWAGDRIRFRREPLFVSPDQVEAFADMASGVAQVFDALCQVVAQNGELTGEFYGLSPSQVRMWRSSCRDPLPWWHVVARMDAFIGPDGQVQICEFNADAPSGQPDMIAAIRTARARDSRLEAAGPAFGPRFRQALAALWKAHAGSDAVPTVGIVYPTEFPEDLALIGLYRRWLESMGWRVVLGSPFNLSKLGSGLALFGERIDVMLRHYMAHWWGERLPVLRGEPDYPDPEPLEQLDLVLDAEARGEVVVVNPFGAILPQNKLSMALFWERPELFPEDVVERAKTWIPETRRLAAADKDTLSREREAWVLKSDFGCEGDEVLIGAAKSQALWDYALEHAIESHWIAQRRIETRATEDGLVPNFGLYVVAGELAGVFVRLDPPLNASDAYSVTAPLILQPPDGIGAVRT